MSTKSMVKRTAAGTLALAMCIGGGAVAVAGAARAEQLPNHQIIVVSGEANHLIDAVNAAPLAGQTGWPILLISDAIPALLAPEASPRMDLLRRRQQRHLPRGLHRRHPRRHRRCHQRRRTRSPPVRADPLRDQPGRHHPHGRAQRRRVQRLAAGVLGADPRRARRCAVSSDAPPPIDVDEPPPRKRGLGRGLADLARAGSSIGVDGQPYYGLDVLMWAGDRMHSRRAAERTPQPKVLGRLPEPMDTGSLRVADILTARSPEVPKQRSLRESVAILNQALEHPSEAIRVRDVEQEVPAAEVAVEPAPEAAPERKSKFSWLEDDEE